MRLKKFFTSTIFLAFIFCSGIVFISCNHNDKTTDETPVADSGATGSEVPTDKMAATPDTMHPAMNDTMMNKTDMKMGAGKPDPAKKGKKGKATVSTMGKMTGPMEADNTGVYSNVEVYPAFPGGTNALQKFFDDNLEYPGDASNSGVDGTVNVMFTVDENGKLSNPHVMGEKMGYGLEEEAIRVVNKMPVWTPGKLKGKNVKTNFTLPVSFQLN